jgi:organic hydroperoxide reductase OsmC/OhrA
MTATHEYMSSIEWTGNRGVGTRSYRAYDRTWEIRTPGKATIQCSNDPVLGGDPTKPNPEDLLLSALASCHMLWYLHLASTARIVVHAYADSPLGIGETLANGAGRMLRATLRPHIVVEPGTDLAAADAIHERVHEFCFIARSVGFPVEYRATYESRDGSATAVRGAGTGPSHA